MRHLCLHVYSSIQEMDLKSVHTDTQSKQTNKQKTGKVDGKSRMYNQSTSNTVLLETLGNTFFWFVPTILTMCFSSLLKFALISLFHQLLFHLRCYTHIMKSSVSRVTIKVYMEKVYMELSWLIKDLWKRKIKNMAKSISMFFHYDMVFVPCLAFCCSFHLFLWKLFLKESFVTDL